MKHKLTIEQRLTGARKALAKLECMGPRYRGFVAGIKKNIRNLEEYRIRGFEFMPYKDRETCLRKQREFHARRKARAQSSRVNAQISLTLQIRTHRKRIHKGLKVGCPSLVKEGLFSR